MQTSTAALRESARHALAAPSIYNTQPWRWKLTRAGLQLWADPQRHLRVTDADARQLMISCGCALHHALVTLAANGWQPLARRFPDPAQRHLVAVVTATQQAIPGRQDVAMYLAIHRRHSDRRAFTAQPVPSHLLSTLTAAAERQGAHLHFLRSAQLGTMREAATAAETAHQADPDYQAELATWTSRPVSMNDGVPAYTSVEPSPRRVPVRRFAPPGSGVSAGPQSDAATSYGIIFTDTDERIDCLQAGEALSAVLLTAAAAGVATSTISDVIEVPPARRVLQNLLDGGGYPQIAFRAGYAPDSGPINAAPRRDPATVIEEHLNG